MSMKDACGTIIERLEQRFRVRIVVADGGSAQRGHHAEGSQRRQHSRSLHRAAVVGVQDQLPKCDVLTVAQIPDHLAGVGLQLARRRIDLPADSIWHLS